MARIVKLTSSLADDPMSVSLNDDTLLEIFKWFVSVDDDGPFTIFLLSEAWRLAVIRHPDLWSYITTDMACDDWQERMHIGITLSQNRPLHLKIICQDGIHPELIQFQPYFMRIRTITLHTLNSDRVMPNLQYIYNHKVIDNVDQILRLPKSKDCIGEIAIMHNIGALEWIKKQGWFRIDDPEPPMLASHPFIRDGVLPADAQSVFEVFIESSEGEYRCTWLATGVCQYMSRRKDEAVGHVRMHLDYKPFVCRGECGIDKCQMRYFTREVLYAHRRATGSIRCESCGHFVRRKNVARHRAVHCRNLSGGALA
ncbi:hypothetical protein FRC14_000534 [Serendipita sp. 396]|nr:hypothetical protein FRC14_000534 [Serendipita sp. 396]